MTKPRVKETDQGIQGEFTVKMYDQFQRGMRDKGWIETQDILKSGITQGQALEVGPGPGYLGLEWLKYTQGTTLKGLDISPDMIALAERNARLYGFSDRVEYVHSSGDKMPFEGNAFDAVFTNGSLHEWADPRCTFNEIWRVLKPGGKVFIADLRRDMPLFLKVFLWLNARPQAIRAGLTSSINAAYTPAELKLLIQETRLANCWISANLIGLTLKGAKKIQHEENYRPDRPGAK